MTKNMTEGKPFGLLIRFALPIMAANILQLFYNMTDSIVVGRMIGVEAFASVSAAGFFYSLVLMVVIGFSQGFGVLMAQRFGAKDYGGLRRAFSTALILSLIFGAVLSAICVAIVNPVLAAMNTPPEIIGGTAAYLRVMFAGLIVTFVYNAFGAFFRATGDSKTPVYALVLACSLNVVLDILLVKFTPLGVAAVAVATIIAQIFSCSFCAWRFRKLPEDVSAKSDARFDTASAKELLRIGGPVGLRNLIIFMGSVVVQYYINGYGTVFIAGIAASKNLYAFLNIVGVGMDAAIATYVAQNYGAGRLDRIEDGVKTARRIALSGVAVIMVLGFIFGRLLLGLYITGESALVTDVMYVAMRELHIMLVCLPTLYMLVLYRSSLQGLGNSFIPMISGFVELVARVLSVTVLPLFIGQWGVYLAETISWPFAALMVYFSYKAVFRRKQMETETAAE